VTGYILPAEAILSAFGLLGIVVVWNLLAIVNLRERISRLEEWIRQEERRRNGG
jgi:hypothetical protein